MSAATPEPEAAYTQLSPMVSGPNPLCVGAPPSQRREGILQNLRFLKMDAVRTGNRQAYSGNGLVMCRRQERFAEDWIVVEDSPEL